MPRPSCCVFRTASIPRAHELERAGCARSEGMKVHGHFSPRPPCGERLGRVDVGDRGLAGHLDLADEVGVFADQVLGAGVARYLGHLGEEAAVPQHGVAALAADGRDADRAALDRAEGRHQPVEQRRVDARHVAELHDRGIDLLAQRGDAGAHRGAETVGEIGIGDETQALLRAGRLFDRRLHLIGHMTQHDHDLDGLRRQRRFHCVNDERQAVGLLQELVRTAHARRTAGGQHQHGDSRRLLREASSSLSSRGCGRVGISASRPPAPIFTISARPTGRPAARRSSTMSKPLYFGDLAQPGRPSTGLPSSSPSAAGCRDRPACRNE